MVHPRGIVCLVGRRSGVRFLAGEPYFQIVCYILPLFTRPLTRHHQRKHSRPQCLRFLPSPVVMRRRALESRMHRKFSTGGLALNSVWLRTDTKRVLCACSKSRFWPESVPSPGADQKDRGLHGNAVELHWPCFHERFFRSLSE